MNKKLALVIAMLTIGLASRFIPHYPNFTAIGSVALLGGALLRKPFEGILLPLAILLLSDIVLNNVIYASESFTLFYDGAIYIYGAIILTALLGRMVAKLNVKNYLGLSVASSVLFFLMTNYGVWATGIMYPQTMQGLFSAYIAAVPYGISQFAGTLVYGFVILAAYSVLAKQNKMEFARI